MFCFSKESLLIYQGFSFPAERIKTLEWQEKTPILARKFLALVSRGRCGRKIARLWRFAAMVAASFLRLVAPYCAIPRDYLSDTPLLRAMGVLGVSTWPIGCDTPSPFSEPFPLGEHANWRCDTPPSKWVSQRYLRATL